MTEKILNGKKNGMKVLLTMLFLYVADIAAFVLFVIKVQENGSPWAVAGIVASSIFFCLGWIVFCGLKEINPQEALVLTLFGRYVGTLKESGFYWVNPFCTGMNPAYRTKLSQSGDVSSLGSLPQVVNGAQTNMTGVELLNKKLSLKVMTLNNSRQKINDCPGSR